MVRRLILLVFFCGALRAETLLALPFFNHADSPGLDWIGESIAETLRDAITPEGALVLDRADRLEAYRRLSLRSGAVLTHASILKIGESLDASLVIYGSYEAPSKGTLRITARILDLKQITQGGEFSEAGALEDLATLEYRLSWQVLQQLHWKGLPSMDEFLQARPPVRLDAVESYVRGLMAVSPEQRHAFFTRAARLDEHYSQPCFQLGKIYWGKKDYKIASGWLERVSRRDPHYLEAQFFLGLCRYNTANFQGLRTALRRLRRRCRSTRSTPIWVRRNHGSTNPARRSPAFAKRSRATITTRTITSTWLTPCGGPGNSMRL